MAQDFAKKKRSKTTRKTKKKPVSGLVWLSTGMASGILLSFLVYLVALVPESNNYDVIAEIARQSAAAKTDSQPVATKPDTDAETSDKPRFNFYTMLPESEVVLPEQEVEPLNTRAQKAKAKKYALQAGAFRRMSDADERRAELLLLGLHAEIQTVHNSDRSTWHRVQVGPFKSRSKLAKARGTLISNGIETLLVQTNAG